MKVRPETPSDYSSITEVNIKAFGIENEAKLIEKIRSSPRYIPELSLVAEIDNKIFGYILFSYIDLVNIQTLPVLGLAPLAVLPEYQNQGIGSILVETGLEIANQKKEALVVVLGHPEYYHRFGFQTSINYQIQSPFDVPEDVFMVKPLANYQEKYQGKILYPPAFSEV
ncbi:MAG: GNAT family N-acetyltransferase [Cuspidothrix sp.]